MSIDKLDAPPRLRKIACHKRLPDQRAPAAQKRIHDYRFVGIYSRSIKGETLLKLMPSISRGASRPPQSHHLGRSAASNDLLASPDSVIHGIMQRHTVDRCWVSEELRDDWPNRYAPRALMATGGIDGHDSTAHGLREFLRGIRIHHQVFWTNKN